MTYRCIPVPQHHAIVLLAPDNTAVKNTERFIHETPRHHD